MEKLIKISLSLCLIVTIIINIVLPINVFAIENNLQSDTNVNSLGSRGNFDNQLKQTIIQMEGMISEENSDVISELQNQVIYYTNMLADNTNIDESSVTNLIDSTNDLIEKYTEYIDYVENDVNTTIYTANNNYFFRNLSYEALVAITVASFFLLGMNLASELLTYAWLNDELDSVYYPIHSDDVMESTVFSEICSNGILESDEYKFSKKETINDVDLYLAIHKFKYTKSVSGRTIVIYDRYDFEEIDFQSVETFVDYGLYAAYLIQEANIIIPFNPIFICDMDGTPCNDLENLTIDACAKYYEDVATLGKGEYKDYNVTFHTSGIKTIQTFGCFDAFVSIYDENGILLTSDDNSGYSNNAFIQYNFEEGKEYTIRVRFFDSNQSGSIKLGIIPAGGISENEIETVSRYEDICTISANDTSIFINETSLQGSIYRFIPATMSNYVFETPYHCDSYICLIDPRQSYYISYNEENSNSAHISNVQVNKELEQNIPYLIVCYVDFTSYVHEYTELICTNITESNHTYCCTDCGYSITSEHNLSYRNVSNSQHEKYCTDCEYIFQIQAHDYTHGYESVGAYKHRGYCECGAYEEFDHEFTSSGVLDVCRYCKLEKDHMHEYVYLSSKDGRTHRKLCSCGVSVLELCFGNAMPGAQATCINCGQILNGGSITPWSISDDALPFNKEDDDYSE